MDNVGNVGNIGEMYVEKCVKEYVKKEKESILRVLERVRDKNNPMVGLCRTGNYISCNSEEENKRIKKNVEKWIGEMEEEIYGEVRDEVCDRISDNFTEDKYWSVYWDIYEKVYEYVVEEIGKIGMRAMGKSGC